MPQNIDIPELGNIHENANYFMNHDQSAMLIAMER